MAVTASDVYGTGQLPPVTHGPLLADATWELPGKEHA
jgi:hypothetical protein